MITETLSTDSVISLLSLWSDDISVYPDSLKQEGAFTYLMVRNRNKRLFAIIGKENETDDRFHGDVFENDDYSIRICELTHHNAAALRSVFSFTRPVLLGTADSFGYGDRLGNAGPAHVRSVKGSGFRPVVAQQSIRELSRTARTAEEVLDAASWAVFQEGFEDGFGADGDHLKTTDDVDVMVRAGYTMFTIDPSDHVNNSYITASESELRETFENLPWNELEDTPSAFLKRLTNKAVTLSNGFTIRIDASDVVNGMIKYGNVILHTRSLYQYLKQQYPDHPAELELSVDETPHPTTLFEHYLIASELQRLGVPLVSLAPRFCGDFEKGIDFKGDIEHFKSEYRQHLAIANDFGGYKLSIHSGSDKFTVYKAVGAMNSGTVHVKTAGTSYLEAIRTVAVCNPDLFRTIMGYSIERFEEDRKTYHISADLSKIPDPANVNDDKLADYLDDDHARQVLHVAYGSVLQSPELKSGLMHTLEENEDVHERFLINHFEKHLSPFRDPTA